jgi:hypothetical protein
MALAVLAALAMGACRLGPGSKGSGAVTLTVTSDFGSRVIATARRSKVPAAETVMRFLQRSTDVETRYGGRFVTAIDGLRASGGGRRSDWFYYVNGIEAGEGAAERDLAPNDRVWWDRHDWSAAMRVPAVVGSYPEPFLHGTKGKLFPVRIDCAAGAREQCDRVADRLDGDGVIAARSAAGSAAGESVLRLVVGEWGDVRREAAAELIEEGPAKSGVYARMGPDGRGGYELDLLDESGSVVRSAGAGAALVAATRFEQQQPTWVVTGTDRAGLARAVGLLDRRVLRHRFAVAATDGPPVALPAGEASR